MGIEFLASVEKGYHVTVLDSVLLMHWRMGGSSSSTSDFHVFHVMTDLSFFLYRKRKCTKRVGQKKIGSSSCASPTRRLVLHIGN